jgi:hypothetical protein
MKFYSKYGSYTIKIGGQKIIFQNGVYITNDKKLIEEMEKYPTFNKDFWKEKQEENKKGGEKVKDENKRVEETNK